MIGKKAFATAQKHAKKTGEIVITTENDTTRSGVTSRKASDSYNPHTRGSKWAIRLHLVENSQPTADKFTSCKGVPQNIVCTFLDTTKAIYYYSSLLLSQEVRGDTFARQPNMCEICHKGKKAQSKLNVQENRLSAAETKRLRLCSDIQGASSTQD